jgi:hypothetical protein
MESIEITKKFEKSIETRIFLLVCLKAIIHKRIKITKRMISVNQCKKVK